MIATSLWLVALVAFAAAVVGAVAFAVTLLVGLVLVVRRRARRGARVTVHESAEAFFESLEDEQR